LQALRNPFHLVLFGGCIKAAEFLYAAGILPNLFAADLCEPKFFSHDYGSGKGFSPAKGGSHESTTNDDDRSSSGSWQFYDRFGAAA
jgi:hypothetical protein